LGSVRFALRKWYLDCVTAAGDAAIVYAARVAVGPVSVPYFELMTAPASHPPTHLRRLSGRTLITAAGPDLKLDASSVGLTGHWTARYPPINISLLDDERGRITWRCQQPGGGASLRLPNAQVLAGLGYAEELAMTVAPWALPFSELRWGRFVSEHRSIVWIDWRGEIERRWVFADGVAVNASVVERDRVAWPGATLEIEPGRVWRHGTLGKTVAGVFAFCVPRRAASAVETKWISPAVLRSDSAALESGWVIHEAVRWG
jgi:hypothetical protein